MSDLRKRSVHCLILRETDKRKAAVSNTARIEAEEVINLFGVAMRSGMRATDLKHMLYAYPTRGSDVPYMP